MEERESTSRKVRELALVWRKKLSESLTGSTGIDLKKVCSLSLVSGNFSLERLKSPPDPPPFHSGVTPYQNDSFLRTDEVEGLLSRLFEYHLRSCIPLVYKNREVLSSHGIV